MKCIPPAAKAQWNEGDSIPFWMLMLCTQPLALSPSAQHPGSHVLPGSGGFAPDAPLLPCQGLPVTIHVELELLTTCTEGHRAQKRARLLLTSVVM